MVLQNKYKAKASRRYNAAKGAGGQQGNEAQKPGFRERHFRRFGAGQRRGNEEQDGAEGSGGDDDEEGSEDEDDEDDDDDDDDEGPHDPRFPSLQKAAQAAQQGQSSKTSTDAAAAEASSSRGKYSRRKMGESNAARIARLESEKDPHLEASDEEPEIDISALVARVRALDPNAQTQAGMAAEIAAQRSAERETASDVEKDIDHSLAWLHEKEVKRQKAKGRAGWKDGRPDGAARADTNAELKDVDADGNKIDYEQIKRDKEKAEALRALKARFQGRALGDREARGAKSRPVPSIKIGPHREADVDVVAPAPAINTSKPSTSSLAPVSPPATSSSSGRSSGGASISSSLSSPQQHDGPLSLAGSGNIAGDDGTTSYVPSAVSESVAAEIDASLSRQRKLAQSSGNDSGSVSSQRSSFSTDFGRRRSPLNAKDWESRPPPTDEIDSFLASINPQSGQSQYRLRTTVASASAAPSSSRERKSSQDTPSTGRSATASASPDKKTSKEARLHRFAAQPARGGSQTPTSSQGDKRGEIALLESFLDDMLS